MIDRLQRLADRLQPVRRVLVIIGFVAAAIAGYLLTAESVQQDNYLLASLIALVWSLSAYAFVVNFQGVPSRPTRSESLFARLKARLQRSWYWFLAICLLVTSLGLIWISLRLVWIMGHTPH
ncbi:MAG: hypothetical protein OQK12_08545 [Motiliproteus sp.]|nr:hypothetical protein [Motiliproteus sp.]MCW9051167.1 hypothetical protein [Motiliproteus sp.]